MLTLRASSADGTRLIAMAGDLDMEGATALEEAALPGAATGPGTGIETELVLDFSQVDFVDSTGMYSLVRIHRAWHERGGRVTMINLSDEISEVFELVGLTGGDFS
ncbi:MAG: STAS domain-containing protein [Bacteroidota bacterium]